MALTQEERQQNAKSLLIYISCIISIFFAYLFGYAGSLAETERVSAIKALFAVFSRLGSFEVLYEVNKLAVAGMAVGIAMGAFAYLLMSIEQERNKFYKSDEVAGTAQFMTRKQMAEYNKSFIESEPKDIDAPSPNMILSKNFVRPIDSRKMLGNSNIVIVGGAGTGKSRFFIKPNILQLNASFIITDPSGEMIHSTGKVLQDHGYKIKIFNISDMKHSNGYNPLHYIRDEAGVMSVIECLIKNTSVKNDRGGDNQFFKDAEKLLYSACIFYLRDFCTDESRKNFSGVVNMINSSMVDENNPNTQSPLDRLFNQVPENSMAWKYYRAFKQAAGKTLKSIIISCLTRIQPFMIPQVINLTKTDSLELDKIGDELTALFIITPQADRTFSFLASMLYCQLFETLYYKGDQQKATGGSERMKIPVRCLMDEFANIGEVPEFPSRLSTMRKYNISATVVLQDLSQIEAMYPNDWKNLIGNCSTIVFLGSTELNTLKYISESLGETTIRSRSESRSLGSKSSSSKSFQSTGRKLMAPDEISGMDPSECLVLCYSFKPVKDKKYDYPSHVRYIMTGDADDRNAFLYNRMAAYDNTRLQGLDSILKAQAEAAKYRLKDKNSDVTDPEYVSDFRIEGDSNTAYNHLCLERRLEELAYMDYVDKAVEAGAACITDPVCIIKLEGMQSKLLPRLVQHVSTMLGKSPMIIFTDIHASDDMMEGICFDHLNEGLAYALQNDYLKQFQANDNGQYIHIVISRHVYDKYKTLVIRKFSELKGYNTLL